MLKLLAEMETKRMIKDIWQAGLIEGAVLCGEYGFPMLTSSEIIPTSLIQFSDRKTTNHGNSFVHFYENDEKFICFWNRPSSYINQIKGCAGGITPDFSIYDDMPRALQIQSKYNNHALGYYMRKQGVPIIPNVRWGNRETYDFCFDGFEQNSVVAIGSHGLSKKVEYKKLFLEGFIEMRKRLNPKKIIIYGAYSEKLLPKLFTQGVEIINFPSRTKEVFEERVK